ncbi:MAG TPA: ABC transporter ATP-binding protein [Petrotogaceae bacterium]|jgi:putative ABC transport system ATP-binding protein|nr:ABC transporter ATP-binding protein [Petrotogaceae bacterium]
MIKAAGLKKIYRSMGTQVAALKGVDLNIEKGEIVAILGPSGCGKSTLLNCLSGIDRSSEGYIEIDGTDITKMNDNQLTCFRARNMGFIFQSYNLIPVLNAVENAELPLLVLETPENQARKRALELLEIVGLKDMAKKIPDTMSGGERQRVAIARALITNPAVVWADEPTGALDTKTGVEIMSLITELNKKNNQTFVIVTHDQRIIKYADRVIHMDSGLIVSSEKVEHKV